MATVQHKLDLRWLTILRGYSRFLYFVQPVLRRFHLRRLWKVHVPLMRHAEFNGYTPSVYGIWLSTNWSDATFVFAVTGRLGFKLFDVLKRKSDEDFLFIDVGANFGTFSVIAADNPRCLQAIAIEPNPTAFSQLERNICVNQSAKVQAVNCGIAGNEGTANLFVSDYHLGAANFRGKGHSSLQVPVRNRQFFDELAALYPRMPVFVKIDVEGFESTVVRELVASQMNKSITEVFLEVSPIWESRHEIDAMLSQLKELGLREQWRSRGKDQFDAYYVRHRDTGISS